MQLLECCGDQLRKDLTRNAGGTLADKTEEEVFEAMKRLAVREENPMVARVALYNMKQDRDEPIRAYGARLRGQAGVCKYTLPCPGCSHDVHYTEAILRDILCRGLADNEIQMDLLSDSNQDMTLEQVLRFVEAKEAGKRSAAHLLIPQAADHIAGSSYKRQKRPPPRSQQGPIKTRAPTAAPRALVPWLSVDWRGKESCMIPRSMHASLLMNRLLVALVT